MQPVSAGPPPYPLARTARPGRAGRLCVLVALLVAALAGGRASAAPAAPPELIAVVYLPSIDAASSAMIDYANLAVPGAGAQLSTAIESGLAPMLGLDRKRPLAMVFAQTKGQPITYAALLPVADGKALAKAAPPYVRLTLRGRFALLAQETLPPKVGAWALAALPGARPKLAPGQIALASLYSSNLLATYRADIDAAMTERARTAAANEAETFALVGTALTGLFDVIAQSSQLEIGLEVGGGTADLTFALAARPKTALAAFVNSQRASDLSLLERVPVTGAAFIGAGQLSLGTAADPVWALLERMLSKTSLAPLVPHLRKLLDKTRGDFALAGAMPPTGVELAAIYGVDNPPGAATTLDALAEAMRKGGARTMEVGGVKSRYELVAPTTVDGVRLQRMVTTYEYSGAAATTPAAVRPARQELTWGVWDDVLGVASANRVSELIAASRKKTAAPAVFAPFLDAARRRKVSMIEIIDYGSLLSAILGANLPKTTAPMSFWLAFGGQRGTMGFSVPASSIAAMVKSFGAVSSAPPPKSL